MDCEEYEHIYFSYKHLFCKNQINNSLLDVISKSNTICEIFDLNRIVLFILISNLSYPFRLTFQRSWFIYYIFWNLCRILHRLVWNSLPLELNKTQPSAVPYKVKLVIQIQGVNFSISENGWQWTSCWEAIPWKH